MKLFDSGIVNTTNIRDRFRIRFINIMIIFFIPLYLIYTYVNFQKGYYAFSLFDAINVILLIVVYIVLRKKSNINAAVSILLITPIPIFLIAFFEGGIQNSAFFWFFLYPIWAIFLKGNKKGIKWVIGLLISIVAFYIFFSITNYQTPYHKVLLMVLFVALLVEASILIAYESMRKKYDKIIEHQNEQLERYRNELEESLTTKVQENEVLSSEIVQIQRDIIFSMGSIGETRSKETANHVKRVAEYAKLFGLKIGFTEELADMLLQASPMHDIGKVGIPDKILNKPGILTKEEFEVMKEHSNIGYEMLKHSNRTLLKMAATIACEHHERYDGSGYPKGLKGEDIHIYARIIALADVFDALGSKRVYKVAWSDVDIFKYIAENRGKHFDPNLVDIFFKYKDEFLAIRDKYSDNLVEDE